MTAHQNPKVLGGRKVPKRGKNKVRIKGSDRSSECREDGPDGAPRSTVSGGGKAYGRGMA